MTKTYAGFGFGPIQSALFLFEAFQSGNFVRYVVAEIDQDLVDAVRNNDGCYTINVAGLDHIRQYTLRGIEMLNPLVAGDREKLLDAICSSDELATALPSVRFFDTGEETSVAKNIAAAIARRREPFPTVIYAAENHNHAAEILEKAVSNYLKPEQAEQLQFLNTVVGKMSGMISSKETIAEKKLETITPNYPRAILVEEFNRILVSRVKLKNYKRGIDVFAEKENLLPFEEAKLYGHNAIHALIAYLSDLRGLSFISEAGKDDQIMSIARDAFLDESGAALIRRNSSTGDPLFTPRGYQEFADDLLQRMVNPNLTDAVDRVGRDHIRKLAYDDRLYGTMHLALVYQIEPRNLALGAAAGVISLIRRRKEQTHAGGVPIPPALDGLNKITLHELLTCLWGEKMDHHADHMIALTWQGLERLKEMKFV